MTSLQAEGLGALHDVFALVEGSRWQGSERPGSERPASQPPASQPPASQRLASQPVGSPRPGAHRPDGAWLEDRLAPGVCTWIASPEQGLTAEIELAFGPQAGAEALSRLAPSSLTVVATVRSERTCWAEVARQSDAEPETCLAGLTYDADGRVSRLIWLRAPLVPPCALVTADPAPDARPVLEGYFEALMNSRFSEAAAHFTADTLYSHPPYADGAERVMFRGRAALRHGFETERGPSPARQIVTDLRQHGSRVFVEGVIEGIRDGGTFFSTASITDAGEIARYVAFYSVTRIAG